MNLRTFQPPRQRRSGGKSVMPRLALLAIVVLQPAVNSANGAAPGGDPPMGQVTSLPTREGQPQSVASGIRDRGNPRTADPGWVEKASPAAQATGPSLEAYHGPIRSIDLGSDRSTRPRSSHDPG